jgi:formylglycine-generating enzyme required for sulfatase activity
VPEFKRKNIFMNRSLLTIVLVVIAFNCFSNNIVISNTTLVNKNTVSNYVFIQFDISWDNSWRTSSGPSNWDAAWVFIKFRIKGQTDWSHASLNWVDGTGTGDGHTVPAGAVIKGANDTGDNSRGVFIYSSSDKAQSSASYPGVQLRWQYGQNSVSDADLVEIYVYGIEMVYVPQGAFHVGSGPAVDASFYSPPGLLNPYMISSEDLIDVSPADGDLYYAADGDGGDQTGQIPLLFPKGYNAFYCMKYEITQEQYVEFLSNLTSTQAASRAYVTSTYRHEISGVWGTFQTIYPYVACNFLSWTDLAAYLDWASLRPMTEFEFEKACRGTLPSVLYEFAWGTAEIASSEYTLAQHSTENEGISSGYNISAGNSNNSLTVGSAGGPMRVGIFAANQNNKSRVTAGATYYGIMEMSGNLFEQTVTIGNPTGRLFRNIHGDGFLDVTGNHNASTWPGVTGLGAGIRGGAWGSLPQGLYVSQRFFAATPTATRQRHNGGRGVRTAP